MKFESEQKVLIIYKTTLSTSLFEILFMHWKACHIYTMWSPEISNNTSTKVGWSFNCLRWSFTMFTVVQRFQFISENVLTWDSPNCWDSLRINKLWLFVLFELEQYVMNIWLNSSTIIKLQQHTKSCNWRMIIFIIKLNNSLNVVLEQIILSMMKL